MSIETSILNPDGTNATGPDFLPIQNKERARQLIDFSGMALRGTDLDKVSDVGNKGLAITEVKLGRKEMGVGQSLCISRIAADARAAGKETLVMLVTHDVPADRDVILRTCEVVAFWRNCGERQTPSKPTTANEMEEEFRDYVILKNSPDCVWAK
jgi:hypothetical protein